MDISPVDAPKVPEDFHLKLRTRFIHRLSQVASHLPHFDNSVSLFKGIETLHKNYDDIDYLVQQESTFWYFFGVRQADCYGVIHNQTGKTLLFVPELSEAYKLWMVVKSREEFKQQYKVDEVLFTKDLRKYLQDVNSTIYLYSGVDTDSDIAVEQPNSTYTNGLKINRQLLWPLISNLRAVKTPEEIQLLKYVCRVTSQAEKIAALTARPGLTQIQLHSVFHFQHSVRSGSIQLGFNSICSSGRDCATLHYVQNDKIIEPNQMILLDMGGRWYGYVADQAFTFPVSGKFTDKQKRVYSAVREAQKAVLAAVRPGVKWDDMHLLAERVILEHLIKIGIVNQYPLEELIERRVGAIFFPHGLGHLFGLKTHDVGGYTEGALRSEKAGLCKLRTRRTLQQGICITVQPGLYFIDFIIEKALKDEVSSKYLNRQKIDEYREVGGVRLEDDIVINKDGYELLSFLPREIEEVEAFLQRK